MDEAAGIDGDAVGEAVLDGVGELAPVVEALVAAGALAENQGVGFRGVREDGGCRGCGSRGDELAAGEHSGNYTGNRCWGVGCPDLAAARMKNVKHAMKM
jgi:hypothetical protein